MRVLIDGYNLQLDQGTGVATYGRGLSGLLSDAGHEVDVLYGRSVSAENNALLREIEFFDRPQPGRLDRVRTAGRAAKRLLWPGAVKPTRVPDTDVVVKDGLRARLPRFDRLWNHRGLFDQALARHALTGGFTEVSNEALGVEAAHWTYPLPLRVKGAANIYTLHDLVPLRLPYTTGDRKARYLQLVKTIAERADLIVTVSETSRRDIVELLGVDASRVVNTYQPVTVPEALLRVSDEALESSLRGVFGLERGRYVLACGAVEPKKNLGRLIEAYLSSDLEVPLVIAGPDGWRAEQELRLLDDDRNRTLVIDGQKMRVKRRVVRAGYVPFRQLIHLIRGATCLAMPSLYEGFGLPIVEAMTCGTPVLTSGRGATAEIAGDAAALVDPYDVASIGAGLRELCHDADRRSALIERGHAQRQKFSVEACGRRLAEAHASIGLARPAAAALTAEITAAADENANEKESA